MALTNEELLQMWGLFMESESRDGSLIAVNKQDLKDAVFAVDQWIEDNQLSYNNALPEPAQTNLTTAQKVKILALIAGKRYGVEVNV